MFLIKDYDKLVGNQTNKAINKLHHCRYCQHGFKSKLLLDNHLERGCLAVTTKTCGYSKPIDPNKSYTYKYQHHKPSGFKINVVNTFNDTVETHIYRGSDCVGVFCCKKMK